MQQNLQVENLTIQYQSATTPLFSNLNACFSAGWTGISGPNGSGKTSLLRLVCGDSSLPGNISQGIITGPNFRYYCPQRTETLPPGSDDYVSALYEQDNRAGRLAGILGIDHSWYYRWETLSFGERKRFQLAVALWLDPDILAVDEPTNHLDLPSITAVENALKPLKCAMLVISHDRRFRETLCSREWRIRGDHQLHRLEIV